MNWCHLRSSQSCLLRCCRLLHRRTVSTNNSHDHDESSTQSRRSTCPIHAASHQPKFTAAIHTAHVLPLPITRLPTPCGCRPRNAPTYTESSPKRMVPDSVNHQTRTTASVGSPDAHNSKRGLQALRTIVLLVRPRVVPNSIEAAAITKLAHYVPVPRRRHKCSGHPVAVGTEQCGCALDPARA